MKRERKTRKNICKGNQSQIGDSESHVLASALRSLENRKTQVTMNQIQMYNYMRYNELNAKIPTKKSALTFAN